jgi:hypothetical protein
MHQAEETRWPVLIILEGKEGYGWWLWVSWSQDTVIYLLNLSRSHTVLENRYQASSRGVLVVVCFSAYKSMSLVRRWHGRIPTARGRNGVANWQRGHSRSLPRCRCGSSILENS